MALRPELRLDCLYRNDQNNWKRPQDQFNKMFRSFKDEKGIQNVGGFRYKSKVSGSTKIEDAGFIVLVTNLREKEWPDHLDLETGIFTYYGDNRSLGTELHNTRIGGNRLLVSVFEKIHNEKRHNLPPFLCFEIAKKNNLSYMKFLGLAVPGAQGFSSLDDLVAVWKISEGKRFQNYRSTFTILEEDTISWLWLDDLVNGIPPAESEHSPPSWLKWVKTGTIKALKCVKSINPRNKTEQLPKTAEEKDVLKKLMEFSPREFEFAAKDILEMMDPGKFTNLEVTPKVKDKGRDLIGYYKLGVHESEIYLNVIGEAKRWDAQEKSKSIGVKPMSRLISRLKHRDLGVFITTAYYDKQVQEEILEDRHPILLLSGGDIVKILISKEKAGTGKEKQFRKWIESIKNKSD